MHDIHLLTDVVVIFAAGLAVAWLARTVGAPPIIGYIFAGVIVGPSGFGFVHQEDVGPLSEFGLVLLLFLIGLELSPEPLLRLGRSLLISVGAQIGITAAIVVPIGMVLLDLPVSSSILLGIVVSLSSTAIVLKQLSDRGDTNTVAGRMTTGILLVQDIVVIAVMLCLPFLAAGSGDDWVEQLMPSVIGLAVLAGIMIFGRPVLRLVIQSVVLPGGPEFVTLFGVVAAFGGAWLAGLVGWSLPLGACVTGLLLAEADMKHQIASDILPLRDVFNALFFISLGMLLDVDVAIAHAPIFAGVVFVTLIGKTIITSGAVTLGGWNLGVALQIGIGLATVSEFGYVLAREAHRFGFLPEEMLSAITVYALGTMVFGAMLVPIAKPLSEQILKALGQSEGRPGHEAEPVPDEPHIIVCGFGTTGQNVAQVLTSSALPFTIVELDPALVAKAKESGFSVTQGDASRSAILKHAGIDNARALVVAINDVGATMRSVAQARTLRSDLHIIADTRQAHEVDKVYEAGATEVLAQDFETSIELVAHVLREMNVPDNIIFGQVTALRSGRYRMLRGMPASRDSARELMKLFELAATRTHFVNTGTRPDGRSLEELNLRAETGVSIIAIVRHGEATTNPGSEFRIESGDVLVLVGGHAQLDNATIWLDEHHAQREYHDDDGDDPRR